MKRLALSVALLALATVHAHAHAFLEHSNIGAGAKVTVAPKALTLDFSEALEPHFSSVSVVDQRDHDATAGPATISGQRVIVVLRALKPGIYKVYWHALSVDTHRTQGSFSFTVTP